MRVRCRSRNAGTKRGENVNETSPCRSGDHNPCSNSLITSLNSLLTPLIDREFNWQHYNPAVAWSHNKSNQAPTPVTSTTSKTPTATQPKMLQHTTKTLTRTSLPRSRAYLATRQLRTTSRQNDKDTAFDPQTTKPEEQKDRAAEELTHEQPVSPIETTHSRIVQIQPFLQSMLMW